MWAVEEHFLISEILLVHHLFVISKFCFSLQYRTGWDLTRPNWIPSTFTCHGARLPLWNSIWWGLVHCHCWKTIDKLNSKLSILISHQSILIVNCWPFINQVIQNLYVCILRNEIYFMLVEGYLFKLNAIFLK